MPTPRAHTQSRPTLTQRRKADTELDIARHAAVLFATQGAEATTAEQIARAAGVAPRTFYRYFRTKEDAVAPLLSAGAQRWGELLAAQPAGLSIPEALERAATAALAAPDERVVEGLLSTRGLLRAARAAPGLRSVWRRVNQDSEERLAPVIAARLRDPDPLEVRLAAAAATAAIRVALETWAETDAPADGPGSPAALAARCMRELISGLGLS